MNELISQHQQEVDELCRRFHVKTLELFGSAAAGTFDPAHSDLDFLVDFETREPGTFAKSYFGLLFGLQDLFQRNVDLVETPAITNPYFLKAVNHQRKVVYAA
jgi:predicted nucleotidyltransferase